jgi:hypothetical protein
MTGDEAKQAKAWRVVAAPARPAASMPLPRFHPPDGLTASARDGYTANAVATPVTVCCACRHDAPT